MIQLLNCVCFMCDQATCCAFLGHLLTDGRHSDGRYCKAIEPEDISLKWNCCVFVVVHWVALEITYHVFLHEAWLVFKSVLIQMTQLTQLNYCNQNHGLGHQLMLWALVASGQLPYCHDLQPQVIQVQCNSMNQIEWLALEQHMPRLGVSMSLPPMSQSGWSPIGCEGFHNNLNIPSPLPTLVFP